MVIIAARTDRRHRTCIRARSRIGDPDCDAVAVLVQLQSHVDAIHRCSEEAEPEGSLPQRSVFGDVSAGDSRATNS
jgi:hypothetical protein